MSQIKTVRSIVRKRFNLRANQVPDLDMIELAIIEAREKGTLIDLYGRCYAPFIPSPPKGQRWEKGRLVSNKR